MSGPPLAGSSPGVRGEGHRVTLDYCHLQYQRVPNGALSVSGVLSAICVGSMSEAGWLITTWQNGGLDGEQLINHHDNAAGLSC